MEFGQILTVMGSTRYSWRRYSLGEPSEADMEMHINIVAFLYFSLET